VCVGTRLGPDGTEIEYRWGRDLPYPSRPALDASSAFLYNGYRVSFPGGEAAKGWRWSPTPI